MFHEFLARSEHLFLPVAAFVFFFLVFLIVLVYVLRRPRARKKFEHVASLPLADDERPEHGDSTRE